MTNILAIICISASLLINKAEAINYTPDAEYLEVKKEYKLNEDGSMEYHYSHKLKLLSYFAIHRQYGETSIIYNPKFQEIEVVKAVTTMADGTKVPAPDNAFNEVLPNFCIDAPAYNHLRRLVITHTALEIGAVIDLEYIVKTKKGYEPFLMGHTGENMSAPVKDFYMSISIPEGSNMNFLQLKNGFPVEMESGNSIKNKITIHSVDLTAYGIEHSVPELYKFGNYFCFSSAKNLNEAYLEFIDQDAFEYVLNKEAIDFIKEFREKYTNDYKFIYELHKHFVNNIKTYQIPLEYTGYQVGYPNDVFEANGGTSLEKVVLFCAMLHQVRIKAFPMMIAPEQLLPNDMVGDLSVFNDFMVRVHIAKDEVMYLPMDRMVDQDQEFNLNGKVVVPVYADMKILELNRIKSEAPTFSMELEMKFDPDKTYDGDLDYELNNAYCPFFKYLGDENIDQYVIGGLKYEFPFEERETTTSDKKNSYIYELESPMTFSNVETKGQLVFVDLPYFKNGYHKQYFPINIGNRKEPFETTQEINESYSFMIKFDKNLKLLNQGLNRNFDWEYGSVSVELKKKKGKLYLEKSIHIKQAVFQGKDLDYLEEAIKIWESENINKLIFDQGDK